MLLNFKLEDGRRETEVCTVIARKYSLSRFIGNEAISVVSVTVIARTKDEAISVVSVTVIARTKDEAISVAISVAGKVRKLKAES